MDDEFLTVAEVAELLKLNAQTIRNWLDRAELPYVRLGTRRVRIRRSDLDAFIEAGSVPTQSDEPLAEEVDEGSVIAWAVNGHRFLPTGGHEIPHWWPSFLPAGGHRKSPLVAIESPHRVGCGSGQVRGITPLPAVA